MSCPSGQFVTANPDNLHVFRAVNAVTGTAGNTQPAWSLLSHTLTADGTCSWVEWGTSGSTGASSSGSSAVPQTLANCTAAGTVQGLGVEFATQTVGGQTQLCGTLSALSSTATVAVCNTQCGNSGIATVTYNGTAPLICDNQCNAKDYIIPSTANQGYFTDIGLTKPAGTVETFGIVAQANAGAFTSAQAFVQPISLYAPGSGTNSGNINNAAQGQLPYYSAPGSSNVLSGGAGTTDGNANNTYNSVTTNGPGGGKWTSSNGAVATKPATGNSTTGTGPQGNLYCIDSTGTSCAGTSVDVRVGYGNSGGVDCTGVTDSTTVLQTMINNAPDFTKFVFPENCKVLVSTTGGSPTAITMQSRFGLEFWFEGRNTNGCDTGSVGPGGAAIIDNSSYVSGARLFYLNQSQRLQFHNMIVRLNGAVDIGFDVDQSTSPPITTQNVWDNVCVQNSTATRNPSFRGWRFSNTSTNNIEAEWLFQPYVLCSTSFPTSGSSNGYGIFWGSNNNQKDEIVDRLVTNGCSVDDYATVGSDFTARDWLMSNSYVNFVDGAFNSFLSGMRTENANTAISISNNIGPHTYIHNDFAASGAAPINCNISGGAGGCGAVVLIGNEADAGSDWFNVNQGNNNQGQNSSLFAAGNREYNAVSTDFQLGAFIVPGGDTSTNNGYFRVAMSTFGLYLTPPFPSNGGAVKHNFGSPALFLEGSYGNSNSTDAVAIQNVPNGAFGAISSSNLEIASVKPGSGISRWLAFAGSQSGLTLGTSPTPTGLAASQVGAIGSTSYTYEIVAHGNVGTTPPSGTATCSNCALVLNSSNYVFVSWPSVPGATSYDVYRTACGGNGICLTNPTGKIGSAAASDFLNISPGTQTFSASAISFVDVGVAGDASVAPTTNTTGGFQTANCSAAGTAANPSVVACGQAISGAFSCATNASTGTCVVDTSLVTANSNILITQRTDTATGTRLSVTCNTGVSSVIPVVTAVTAGTSFTINLGTFSTNPECFNYMIVN